MHPLVLTTPALSAYITVLVAFVAGAFSLLNLTVSKESKVSEFRQAWIDALREDICLFVSHSQWIATETTEYLTGRTPDYTTHLANLRDSMIAMNQASTRVKLRLHQEERDTKALMLSMKAVQEFLESAPDNPKALSVGFRESSKEVEINAALVLRNEWKVVKKGEKGYRFAKRLAYLSITASILMLILLVSGFLQTAK
jgi:hypothetical protein